MNAKNSRKKEGAFVWHKNELKRVSSQDVGKDHIVLDDLIEVKKLQSNLLKLAIPLSLKI